MKRHRLFLISIMALLVSIAPSASVLAAEQEAWTFEEVLEFSKDIEKEREDYCRGNPEYVNFPEMCYREYAEQRRDEGKYGATDIFLELPLHITAFNLAEKYARVYFTGENIMSKHMGMEDHTLILDKLYLTQQNKEKRTDCAFLLSQGKEAPTCNLMYFNSESRSGHEWLPAGQEIEIPIGDLDFAPEKARSVEATVISTSGVRWVIGVRVGTCLESPDYQEGMECQARFTSDNTEHYIPVPPRENTPDNPTEPSDSSDPANQDDLPNDITQPDNNQKDVQKDQDASQYGKGGIDGEDESVVTEYPLTPDTGAREEQEETNTKTIIMPWWMIVIFGFGFIAILWLVLPNKRK